MIPSVQVLNQFFVCGIGKLWMFWMVLNLSKLISGTHLSFRINLLAFKTFRGSLFHKQETGSALPGTLSSDWTSDSSCYDFGSSLKSSKFVGKCCVIKYKTWNMFQNIIFIDIPYARHYKPRFVYFLLTFLSPKTFFQGDFFLKLLPYVWLKVS